MSKMAFIGVQTSDIKFYVRGIMVAFSFSSVPGIVYEISWKVQERNAARAEEAKNTAIAGQSAE